MKKMLSFLILASWSLTLFAAPSWKIDASKSNLTFVATQNNAPVKGSFKSFEGDIVFDKADLKASKARIVVETGSVSTSYKLVADTLKTPEWLNDKLFPKATFESTSIEKVKENQYQAQGKMTIRDKSFPVTIDFSLNEKAPQTMEAKGEMVLKRTEFGVGQGEWQDTSEIKDDVKVNFDLMLTGRK